MKPWRVLARRTLLERRWLEVEEQRIGLPHGGEIDEFHLIKSPDWVAVIALTPEGDVVCVEQYRHGAERVCLELPAGVIEEGEAPVDTARRELLEETGYGADAIEPLISVNTEPSRHTNRAHFFFASGARHIREQSLDASEHIRVRPIAARELVRAAENGELVHGLHLGPIFLAVRRGLLAV
jgi:8-oxo-dGTP pyrophosphatase MutT (NUDIX family)